MWENNTENVESVEHIINPWTQELRKLHKAHKVCYKGSTVLSYYFLFKIYMCGLGQRSFSVEERRFSVFLPFFFFFPEERYVSGETVERCAPISCTRCCRKSGIFETTERILGRAQHPGFSPCVKNQQVFKQRCRFACWLSFAVS